MLKYLEVKEHHICNLLVKAEKNDKAKVVNITFKEIV